MKVVGDIEIINRLLPSTGVKQCRRSTRAHLCIGNSGEQSALLVCTQQDRHGTKYMLKNNVECIFAKFVNEGKCTVRLHEPAIDLCISKADSVQLKGFLTLVKVGASGKQQPGVTLGPLLPASTKQMARLKTKMLINSRVDYPVTKGFPSGLETLAINGCSLKKVESRIMHLSKLVTLDLSGNSISTLPQDWSVLNCLAELKLARNRLEYLPAGIFTGQRSTSLSHFDVSENQLNDLPSTLISAVNMAVLKLDCNKLTCLPVGLSRLTRLVQLSAANNLVHVLPGDFARLSLQSLDLFGNPFDDIKQSVLDINDVNTFPTLFELSARSVKNHRVPYTASDVGRRIAECLDEATTCWCCRNACLQPVATCRRVVDLRNIAASVTGVDTLGRTRVPCLTVLCSNKCVSSMPTERPTNNT